MGRFEFIDHTADIAIKAYGRSLEEAFAVAAEAMFAIITDGSTVEPEEEISLSVESLDREGLLVGFLSQLIVLHEADGWVFGKFQVSLEDERHLTAVVVGEKYVPEKHGRGTQVKGVSYHMMEIVDGTPAKPGHVQVLFDI